MRLATLMVLAGGVLACGPDTTALGSMNSTEIVASDDMFAPAADTVAVGQNIRWTFNTLNQHTHNVTWDSGPTTPANSGDKIPATSYTVFFGQVGTYSYHCTFHGTSAGGGMAGTLVVQ